MTIDSFAVPSRLSALLGCALLAGVSTQATVVYENFGDLIGYAGNLGPYSEIADDIYLDGYARIFESLSVAYTAYQPQQGATMTVRLYNMDGAPNSSSFGDNTPGTLLFEDTTAIVDTLGELVTFTDSSGSIILPDHVAVALSFTGIDFDASTSDAGPFLLDPPSVGWSHSGMWIKPDGGEWGSFVAASGDQLNFGLQLTAVPDGGASLNLLSLPLLLGAYAAVRRSQSVRA